jgi:hypothetical protein
MTRGQTAGHPQGPTPAFDLRPSTTLAAAAASGFARMRAERQRAMHDAAQRRLGVLSHPDLAARLCEPPLSYSKPQQWNGYLPPATGPYGARRKGDPDSVDGADNESIMRRTLLDILRDLEARRHAGRAA